MANYPGVRSVGKGKYELLITIRRAESRQYVRRVVSCANKSAASRIRERLRDELLNPQPNSNQNEYPTLSDFADSWLKSKANEVSRSTLHTYAWGLDNLRELGTFSLDKIKPLDVKQWRDSFNGISATTANNHLRVVKTLISDACDEYNLPNPATRVKSIREHKPREDPNLFTQEELKAVLRSAKEIEPQWYALFATLASTGGRFGEVSALQWRDIDFEKGIITIQRAQWRGVLKDTKTGSKRIVPMPKLLQTILRSHYRAQGKRPQYALVFPSQNGKFLRNGGGINKPWTRILSAANIDHHVTIHGLRRTYNNALRQITGTLVVQSLTGHSTDGMTAHYSHVGLDEKISAVSKLDKWLR